MKLSAVFIFVIISLSANSQDTTARMPPEETQPTSYWWWIISVIVTLAIGILVYRLLKKDPRKDG